ncbi:hypothetical protein CHL78_003560 [Romboutsia weinsteinii]|uniref:Uncharacterized protein n=1 Tax=Romboutsia weinsteinii TaxID=2020949 RepID=A0A371J8C4_9FIRM|nr:DUF6483 family protein [Romboutsia weinsteinii]RDY29009.1 hypothetical protein CHL78_003560 [Romboutsia weinsteinii]
MDIIQQITDELKRIVAKLLLGKKFPEYEDMVIEYNNEESILLISLTRLIIEGKINEAENILFDAVKNSNYKNISGVVIDFYSMLLDKSDDELSSLNFSKEEIYEGIEDIKKLL